MVAQNAEIAAISDLGGVQREIERTHAALEQVRDAVARERCTMRSRAFEQGGRLEGEIEADYEAWLLLLEQMKQAYGAPASNLGRALALSPSGSRR
jgi:hypothetical protein